MIIGEVTDRRQALVSVRVRSADGAVLEIEAILDTGFTDFLTLPQAIVEELGLPRIDSMPILLADGSERRVDVFEGRIYWDGAWQAVLIQASEGRPLLGMGLLYEHLVNLEVVAGGTVSVESLE